MDKSVSNLPVKSGCKKHRLWWLNITAPVVALIVVNPVEEIMALFDINIEKGMHWFFLCWIVVTFPVQFILGMIALAEPGQPIQGKRLLRVAILTSIEGVLLWFIGMWLLFFLWSKFSSP